MGKMREAGFRIEQAEKAMTIYPQKAWEAVDITTAPHPLFPTDLQAQFMALMSLANGTSVITETVFENRFMHVNELMRLGPILPRKLRWPWSGPTWMLNGGSSYGHRPQSERLLGACWACR